MYIPIIYSKDYTLVTHFTYDYPLSMGERERESDKYFFLNRYTPLSEVKRVNCAWLIQTKGMTDLHDRNHYMTDEKALPEVNPQNFRDLLMQIYKL